MRQARPSSTSLHLEVLESRCVLSLSFGGFEAADHHRPGHDGGPGGGDEQPSAPAIDLPTVLAHEIGHSLGLGHSTSSECGSEGQPLMCPFYLGSAFELHQEDIDRITGLYPEAGEPLDTTNTSGRWSDTRISYSFMTDGTQLEQETVFGRGRPRLVTHVNSLFSSLDAKFGTNEWQSIYAEALDLWAAASATDGPGTVLVFEEVTDSGAPFDADGEQGDIRFGAHAFDGPGGTLAHAYFAPPNGNTAAGDAHIDEAENWQDLRSSTSSQSATIQSGSRLGGETILSGRGLAVSSLQLGVALVPVDTAESTQQPKNHDDVRAPKRVAAEVIPERDERVSSDQVAQARARAVSIKVRAGSEAADRALEAFADEVTLDGFAVSAALGLWSDSLHLAT